MRRVSTMIGAAALALTPALVWAQQPAEPYKYACGPYMMGWGGGWPGLFFGPLFMIIGLAIAIGLALVMARAFLGPWGWEPPGHAALDILKERYARGEIAKEEFDERRRALGE